MLEVLATAEPLPIRILDPALHHGFIGQVEGVLEIRQPHYQPGRLGGPPQSPIEAAEFLIEPVPVDESGEPTQRVTRIEDLIETAAIEVAGTWNRRLGSHGKTPGLSGSAPGTGILQCVAKTKNPSTSISCGLFRADELVYPAHQFDHSQPINGLDRVVEYFPSLEEAWEWLVTPNLYTRCTAPIDRLQSRHIEEVVRAAGRAHDFQ
jgi:hypothetical protein